MAARILQVLLRILLLTGLSAAVALHIDYARPVAAFCGGQGGCALVRASGLSHLHGVPLPTIGAAAFTLAFFAALALEKRAHVKLLAAALAVGGLCALALIGAQLFVIHAVCPWCMAADLSAIAAAAVALLAARAEKPREPWPRRLAWFGAVIAAVAAPVWWAGAPVPVVDLPDGVRRLERPDRVSIVAFTDFECPFCRRLHQAMDPLIDNKPGAYQLVRLMVPLKIHPGAEPAARAYLCAPPDKQGRMADKLYAADPASMTKDGMAAIAGQLGLDRAAFARCYEAPATAEAIARDTALFESLHAHGLPTTFVGDKLILGADIRAFEQAVGGRSLYGMLALLALAFAAAALISLRAPRTTASELPAADEQAKPPQAA